MATNAINSAGIQILYASEATAGTRPTTGYVAVAEVKNIPAIGDSVNTHQVTTLDQTVCHSYIPGLRDSGGSVALTVNECATFRTAWETCVTAYGALTSGKQMWFQIKFPVSGMKSMYFPGQPVAAGFGGASVDSPLENTANIIIRGDYTFETAST